MVRYSTCRRQVPTQCAARANRGWAVSARRGLTLVELLVVLAILSILIAILLPSISRARGEGQRAKCLSNLRSLGQGSAAYAGADASGKVIPEHPKPAELGTFDGAVERALYGGGDGIAGEWPEGAWWSSNGPYGGAAARPLNRFLFGADHLPDTPGTGQAAQAGGMELFQCPSDTGWTTTAAVPEVQSLWLGNPMHRVSGTSYAANMAAMSGPDFPPEGTCWSIGPYGRSGDRMASPSETILYWEDFALAAWENSEWWWWTERPKESVRGWHGRIGRFNIAYGDGAAATASMTKDDWQPSEPSGWMMMRGRGYRLDCLPDAPVMKGQCGNQ